MQAEERTDTKAIFEGRIIKVRVDTVRLPNARETSREVVELARRQATPGAARAVVAFALSSLCEDEGEALSLLHLAFGEKRHDRVAA